MSRPSLSVILALVVAFAAFMTFLAYSNGKLADDLLREKIQRPVCVEAPYSVGLRPACVVVRA